MSAPVEIIVLNIFEEQLHNRISHDRLLFSRTIEHAGKSVMGFHQTDKDDMGRDSMREAIGHTLAWFGMQAKEAPDAISDFDKLMDYSFHPRGIMRRKLTLDKKWYRKTAGCFIAIDDRTGLAVALLPDALGGYSYIEPFTHRKIKVRAGNKKFFTRAWQIIRPLPLRPIGFRELMGYLVLSLSLSDILVTILALTLFPMFQVGLLSAYRNFYEDTFYFSLGNSYYIYTAVSMSLVILSRELARVVKDRLCGRIWLKQSADLEGALMARVMLSPVESIRKFGSGEASIRILSSRNMVKDIAELFFGTVIFVIEITLYMLFVNKYCFEVADICGIVITVSIVVSILASIRKIHVSKKERELYAKEYSVAWGIISSIQKLKLSGALKRAYSKWGNIFAKRSAVLYNPPLIMVIRPMLTYAMGMIGIYLGYVAYSNFRAGQLGFVTFMLVFAMILAALENMGKLAAKASAIATGYDMVRSLLGISPEMQDDREPVENIRGSIRLRNVTFAYSLKDGEILKNFNLSIPAGEYVAIVGSTGCGKSTLIRLILGFEHPQKGVVHFDEKDLDTMDLRSVRSKIGCVLQESRLFMGTIFFNLKICNPSLTLDEAWDALERAGVADDIRQMPMGIYTLISEGSGGISGGQRQRILLARAMAMDPRVLILDEATSALDNVSQKKVTQALKELSCTRIVIAHRLTTVMECDRILVMSDGKIVDEGTYDELKEKEGLFREFIKKS